uniref:Uncharacterized protein n=1 Tax=Pararge aegeria TaxID=116150 RepID=S4PZT7_9NEOP
MRYGIRYEQICNCNRVIIYIILKGIAILYFLFLYKTFEPLERFQTNSAFFTHALLAIQSTERGYTHIIWSVHLFLSIHSYC